MLHWDGKGWGRTGRDGPSHPILEGAAPPSAPDAPARSGRDGDGRGRTEAGAGAAPGGARAGPGPDPERALPPAGCGVLARQGHSGILGEVFHLTINDSH